MTLIDKIAINHVIGQVDSSYTGDVKIFQLSGNTKLENLLELLHTKMKDDAFSLLKSQAYSTMSSTSTRTNDSGRLDKLERMMETMMDQMTSLKAPSQGKRSSVPTCDHCHKKGHTKSKCFKLMSCSNCSKVGHVAKYCRAIKRDSHLLTKVILMNILSHHLFNQIVQIYHRHHALSSHSLFQIENMNFYMILVVCTP